MEREIFSMRVTPEERSIIQAMALRLKRNQSDAVRTVVLEVARTLAIDDHNANHDDAGHTEIHLCQSPT